MIKASQEREELQRKGDELSGKINEAEKKLKGLQNTLLSLTNTNINLATKIGQKGVSKGELAQKEALEEQCNAASENLFKKKNELKKLEQEYEQDAKRLTETLNRVHHSPCRNKPSSSVNTNWRKSMRSNTRT